MEYLTTHDLVRVNNVVTGEVVPYNYVTLEASMAAQYRYGGSTDTVGQAGTLLQKLLFAPPFAVGRLRTALISTLTFLNANGYATILSDAEAASLVRSVDSRAESSADAIGRLAKRAEVGLGNITLRKLITLECNQHEEALKLLAGDDGGVTD